MSDNRQPWERQPEDTPKSWAAFCIYRDLGADRSIDKAYRISVLRKSPESTPGEANKRWKIWSSECNWVARTAAYDEHIDVLNRAEFEKERLKVREERRKLIRLVKSKLPDMIEKCDLSDPTVSEVVNLMRLVLQEERAEYDDEPTQRQEHSGLGGSPIQFSAIDDALRKVYGENDKGEE